ncbi:hypothetical protein ACJW30_02G009800 [Castanea mollissima]
MTHISDIKLIRTDTTLDLSQKAEKASVMDSTPQEINLISCGPMTHISDIKLIRTDTTLDLSQKAEKGMNISVTHAIFYCPPRPGFPLLEAVWDNTARKRLSRKKRIDDFFAALMYPATIARMMDANNDIQCVTILKMIMSTVDSI